MKSVSTWLDDKSEVKYTKQFLSNSDSEKLFQELKTIVPWTHGIYKMFGKPIKTPRLLFAMKDEGLDITGSYKVTDSMAWTPLAEKLKKKIEKETGKKITYCQLNYYRDGNDYIGFHTDKEVVKDDIIASISLGANRTFKFRNIKDKKTKSEMTLENGSLLIMNDHAAKYNWKHALPKMKNLKEERINITFRPQ